MIKGSFFSDVASERLKVEVEAYHDGGTALQLTCEDGEPFATISVNINYFTPHLPKGVFYVKDWSENAPIVAEMKAKKLLKPRPIYPRASTGFVTADAFALDEAKLNEQK